jgi:uncharacterized protein YggE
MKKLIALSIFTFFVADAFAQGAGNVYRQQYSTGYKTKKVVSQRHRGQNNAIRNHSTSTNSGTTVAIPGKAYYGVKDTIIDVQSSTMINVNADAYIAIFGVVQVSNSIDSAHYRINQRIEKFTTSLEKLKIDKKNIHIDFISQVPVFEREVEKKLFSKAYNELPKGFELQKNIHVYYTDRKSIEAMLIEAAKNEIYDLVKVDYIINDLEAVYDTLRRSTTALMQKKMKDFEALNVKFTPIYQTVSEDISSMEPIDRYSKFKSFSNANINAEKRSTDGTQRVGEQITLFYDKPFYDNFDKVIHPGTISPTVQLVYHLNMRYVLKKQE